MKILKRSIPLLVAAVLIVLSFPISASAESDLVPDTYVDLLQADKYYVNIDQSGYVEIGRPYKYLTNAYNVTMRWNASGDDIKYHDYYFTIQATGKPSSVIAMLNSQHQIYATYIGSVGDLHQYYFYSANSNIGDLRIYAEWSYLYVGNFAILTFVGLRDYAQNITNASYNFRLCRFANGGLDYPLISSGSALSLPVGDYHYGTYPNEELFSGELFVWLGDNVRKYDYADSVSFLVQSLSPISSYSVSLVDTNTTVKAVLKSELLFSCSRSLSGGSLSRQMYYYQVNADLRGYQLTQDIMIQLYCEAEAVYGPNSVDQMEVQINCYAASLVPPNAEVPWYLSMYTWIDNSITSNIDRVVDAIGSLGGAFNDPDSMQDVQDINSSVANKQDQANSINDKMNSVTKPKPSDVTTGTPDISGILTGSSAPLVMSTITGGGNGIFVTVLLLVFTFALVGFIFFGKR